MAVHRHAGGERMFRADEPAGEREAVVFRAPWQRRKNFRHAGLHAFTERIVHSACPNKRWAAFRKIAHDHRGGQPVVIGHHGQFRLLQGSEEIALSRVRPLFEKCDSEQLALRRRAGGFGEAGDRCGRFPHRETPGFVGRERARRVEAQLVDLPAPVAHMFAVADAQGGAFLPAGDITVRVADYVHGLLLAVYVDRHAGGALGAVVGEGDMDPFARREAPLGFNGRNSGDPARVDVPTQPPIHHFNENAVADRDRCFVGQHGSGLDLIGLQPEGDREATVADEAWDLVDFEVALARERGRGSLHARLKCCAGFFRGHAFVGGVEGKVEIQALAQRRTFRCGIVLPRLLRRTNLRFCFLQCRAGLARLRLEGGKLRALIRCGRFDPRLGVPPSGRPAGLGDVVEIVDELVIFFLAERIVFVVVATRAARGQAHPDRRGRVDPIHRVFEQKLVDRNSLLGVVAIVAVKAGRDELFVSGLGQKVSGQLLDRKLVEGQVGVERIDHPVAPAPHFARSVVLITVRVRIPRRLEPRPSHTLAVAGRLQQPVHGGVIGGIEPALRGIGQKGAGFRAGRRQAGEVQTHSS